MTKYRIKTEEEAKVVASVWGEEFIQLLAALTVLHRTILIIGLNAPGWLKERMNSSFSSNRPSQNM